MIPKESIMRYGLRLVFFFILLPCVGCQSNQPVQKSIYEVKPVKSLDLSKFPDTPPSNPLNLLFIHHSCGGHWLADKGPSAGDNCIYETHPNGGGLRSLLEKNNYVVHEASYNSIIGDKTDILDWPPKFQNQMDRILRTKMQDELLPEGERNQIIMFKSCYPNNNFPSDESVKKAQEAYKSLLPIFEKYPHTLFVAVTAPPLVRPYETQNSLKAFVKKLLGRYKDVPSIGRRARYFNNWLKDVESGWLSGYPLKNVVVFDYYDILTKNGKSNWAEYPTKEGRDSHPSSEGNSVAAQEFVHFLNRAVHRAGI